MENINQICRTTFCIYLSSNKTNGNIPILYKSQWYMSSIDNRGENEFVNDESNIVGKSEDNTEEEDKKIIKSIKKEISNEEDDIK